MKLRTADEAAIEAAIIDATGPADAYAIAYNLAECAGDTKAELETMVAPYVLDALEAAGLLR